MTFRPKIENIVRSVIRWCHQRFRKSANQVKKFTPYNRRNFCSFQVTAHVHILFRKMIVRFDHH
ncbi:unnamed protein product [Staurois parvus]|uniref:Transposase n=1 Tax=Staurois parvus TaxID=386267 RepID=A0ABN9B2T5_9NEOB|nr:unnamed protein product [Staurois parvus]